MKKIILILMFLFISIGFVHAVNDTTGNTWVLDTVGNITTAQTKIVWIYWTNITTTGDDLIVKEYPSGKIVIKAKGQSGVDIGFPFPGNSGQLQGLELDTLDSGEVLIRLGKDN